ncbi:MAG: dTDP-4-dehydrorhamnose 3,5-epimerase [Acidobacteriota bacterium]
MKGYDGRSIGIKHFWKLPRTIARIFQPTLFLQFGPTGSSRLPDIMEIRPLGLEGSYEITLTTYLDDRGYFMRTYDRELAEQGGLQTHWVQENQSQSIRKHTIRGLHFQKPPHAETKLLRVVKGAIMDVFVDLRKDSATYGRWDSIELSAANLKMLYIPKGFAHGFCTLEPDSIVLYKVDSYYAPQFEGGLRWNDPTLGIPWPTEDPFLSDRDRQLELFDQFFSPF